MSRSECLPLARHVRPNRGQIGRKKSKGSEREESCSRSSCLIHASPSNESDTRPPRRERADLTCAMLLVLHPGLEALDELLFGLLGYSSDRGGPTVCGGDRCQILRCFREQEVRCDEDTRLDPYLWHMYRCIPPRMTPRRGCISSTWTRIARLQFVASGQWPPAVRHVSGSCRGYPREYFERPRIEPISAEARMPAMVERAAEPFRRRQESCQPYVFGTCFKVPRRYMILILLYARRDREK